MSSTPRYDLDAQTARQVAAWIKAYGYRPLAREVAAVAGVTAPTMRARLRCAYRRGFLVRRHRGRYRVWEPVWELLPEDLRTARPQVTPRVAWPVRPWLEGERATPVQQDQTTSTGPHRTWRVV